MSIVKTKGIAVVSSLTDEDVAPVRVESGEIETGWRCHGKCKV